MFESQLGQLFYSILIYLTEFSVKVLTVWNNLPHEEAPIPLAFHILCESE